MAESSKQINESENAKLFRTRMDIFVLNALNEKDGHGYGYDVISYIQEHTKGHYKIKSISTIYNILKRLEASGYVSTVDGGNESYGAARVYYALTPAGKEYLEQDKKEWKYIRTLLDNLVSDESFDLDNEDPPYSASVLKPLTKRSRDNSSDSPAAESAPVDVVNDSTDDLNPPQEQSVAGMDVEEDVPFYNYTDDATVLSSHREETHSFEPVKSNSSNINNDSDKNDYSEKNLSFGEAVASQYASAAEKYYQQSGSTQPQSSFAADDDISTLQNPDIEPEPATLKQKEADYSFRPIIPEVEKKDFSQINETNNEVDTSPLSPYIQSLKKNLMNEGYLLHTFNTEQKPSTVRYFFSTKIMRDMSIASFLYLVVTLLLTNLFKGVFGVSLFAVHLIAGIGFVFTLIAILSYFNNPRKRKKDAVNLKLLNSVLLLGYIVCFMAVAVYYLFTSKYSFYSSQMYAPAIILSTIPFSGLMFSILYASGKYFQK